MVEILSARTRRELDDMHSRYQRTKRADVLPQTHEDTIFPPEVYFAKPQSASGIPAKSESDDEPGSGPCDIYKIDDSDPPALVAVTDFEKTVYNYSESPIGQDWITIGRTKYGTWSPIYTSDSGVVIGKMDEEIGEDETKTMRIYVGSSLSDSGETLEVSGLFLGSGETIAAEKWVKATKYHGTWYVTTAECP